MSKLWCEWDISLILRLERDFTFREFCNQCMVNQQNIGEVPLPSQFKEW